MSSAQPLTLASIASDVSAHNARLDSHDKRHDQQDAGLLRVEDKLERIGAIVLTGLVAAIGALITGALNLVKH